MDLESVNFRIGEIKSAIEQNNAKLEQLAKDARELEKLIVLQNGALQDCQYWEERMRQDNLRQVSFDELNKLTELSAGPEINSASRASEKMKEKLDKIESTVNAM